MRLPFSLAALLALLPSGVQAQAAEALPLPATVAYPEGVAYDPASRSLYAGSAVDGTLVRIDAATGRSTPVAPAGRIVPKGSTFPAMLGMKVDRAHRLWIAGGWAGRVTVVDPRDGRIVATEQVSSAPRSLLNDLVFAGDAAYVTDTFVPTLWRARLNRAGAMVLDPWIDLRGTPIAFDKGPNLNGIAATPDGRTLIVVQMNKGLLFRIDVATKAVTAIDVGGVDLTGSDGLLLDGRTLYVVRQWAGEIVTLAMDANLGRGREVARLKNAGLHYPATATKVGDDLVVVNAQFDVHDAGGTPTGPFTLSRIKLTALRGTP